MIERTRSIHSVGGESSEEFSEEIFNELPDVSSAKRRMTLRKTMKNILRMRKLLEMENSMFQRYIEKIGLNHFQTPASATDIPSSGVRIRSRVFTQTADASSYSSGKILRLNAEQKCEIAQYEQAELKKEIENFRESRDADVEDLFSTLESYHKFEDAIAKEKRLFNKHVASVVATTTYPDDKSRAFSSFSRNYMKRLDHLTCRLLRDSDRCREILKKLSFEVLDKAAQSEHIKPVDMQELKIHCTKSQKELFRMTMECFEAKSLANLCTHAYDLQKKKLDEIIEESRELKDLTKRKIIMTRRMEVGVKRFCDQAFTELKGFRKLKSIVDEYEAPEVAHLIKSVSEDKILAQKLVISKRQMNVAKLRLQQHKRLWSHSRQSDAT